MIVDFEREVGGDARIVTDPIVHQCQALARIDFEHGGVAVVRRLPLAHREIVGLDDDRNRILRASVVLVALPPQQPVLQRAVAVVQIALARRLAQQFDDAVGARRRGWIAAPGLRGIGGGERVAADKGAGLEPGPRIACRHRRRLRDLFVDPGLDIAEAPEGAVFPIVIAVVIGKAGFLNGAGERAPDGHAGDNVNRERHLGRPGVPVSCVAQGTVRRAPVAELHRPAKIAGQLRRQPRLVAAGDIQQIAVAGGQTEQDVLAAAAEKIGRRRLSERRVRNRQRDRHRIGEAVAAEIEVEQQVIVHEIDKIDGARRTDVGDQQSARVQAAGKSWRVVEHDRSAEATPAKARPAHDGAVADPHEMRAAIAERIGEQNALVGVAELRIGQVCRRRDLGRNGIAGFAEAAIPPHLPRLNDQEIGQPVAGEIGELGCGAGRLRRVVHERLERPPMLGALIAVETGASGRADDAIEPSVAGEVDQRLPAGRDVALRRHRIRRERRREARVALIAPEQAGRAGAEQQSGQAFAVKIGRHQRRAAEFKRQLSRSQHDRHEHLPGWRERLIGKTDAGHRQGVVETVVASARAAVIHPRQQRDTVLQHVVQLVDAGEARLAAELRHIVKNHHAMAEPIGADFKAAAIARKRVRPGRPGSCRDVGIGIAWA